MKSKKTTPTPAKGNIQLYHHKTDGGAEYLCSNFITCPNGHKEGVFRDSKYIVRIDGDITKDAELMVREDESAKPMTPQQAMHNFKLFLELSPRNSYEQYRAAVRELAEICIQLGIEGDDAHPKENV